MSDTAEQREECREQREECREQKNKLSEIWSWFKGNGNRSAAERLTKLEDYSTGREDCRAMEEVKEHLSWHKESKIYMWGILIPLYVMLLGMLLEVAGVI